MSKLKYMLMLTAAGFLLCFIYLHTQINKAEHQLQTTKNNYAELKSFIAQIPSEQPQAKSLSTSLFYRLNEISEQLNMAQQIESVNPSPRTENYSEKLEIRLSNLYLDQCVAWLNLWQAYPDIQIEQLSMQKNNDNFFSLSMGIIRYE